VSEAQSFKDLAEEIPYVRKTGRYAFFALCAFGVSLQGFAAALACGLSRDISGMVANAAFIAAFLVLRDMSRNWDLHLIAVANARKATGKAEA